MPRRYRIQWPVLGGGLPYMECSAEQFDQENDDMAPEDHTAVRSLTRGQSVTFGGGAAPAVTILCIEE